MSEQDRARYEAQAYMERVEDASLSIPTVLMEDLEKLLLRVSHMPGDPYSTAYREGERSMVLWLKQLQENARKRRQGA